MAVVNVKRKAQDVRRSGSALGKLGSAAGLIGSIAAIPATGGASLAGAVGSAQSLGQQMQGSVVGRQGVKQPETMRAMERRTEHIQEDPMESLREAQAALSQSGIDPQTRAELEAPILKALQARRV